MRRKKKSILHRSGRGKREGGPSGKCILEKRKDLIWISIWGREGLPRGGEKRKTLVIYVCGRRERAGKRDRLNPKGKGKFHDFQFWYEEKKKGEKEKKNAAFLFRPEGKAAKLLPG